MLKNIYLPLLASIFLSVSSLFADETDSIEFSRPTLFVWQEGTRIVQGGDHIRNPGGLDGIWVLPTGGYIDFQAKKNERLGLEVMLAATYYSAAAANNSPWPQNYIRNISVVLPRLDASYVFGNVASPFLRVDVGNFQYRYNEYSQNLGQYMFRSWAYPGFIQTGNMFGYVGNKFTNLTGLRLSQSLGMFSHEFLATLETELTPIYDLNLTYMAMFNYHNILKIGGGVQFSRVLSDFDPPEMTIHYFEVDGVSYALDDGTGGRVGSDYYAQLMAGIRGKLNSTTLSTADSTSLDAKCKCAPEGSKVTLSSADSVKYVTQLFVAAHRYAVIDSVGGLSPVNRPTMHNLTGEAIKPVVYFSFDPKSFLHSSLLGPKDLVVYGEAAILGVKNYPVYYNHMWQRVPIMMGVNLPTLKVLDVLSVEAEYYASRWMPAYRQVNSGGYQAIPVPFLDGSYYPTDWDKDNWKWSVFAERTLVRGVTLSAQAASDHARSWDWASGGKTNWEMYTTPSEWYWALKLGVKI